MIEAEAAVVKLKFETLSQAQWQRLLVTESLVLPPPQIKPVYPIFLAVIKAMCLRSV